MNISELLLSEEIKASFTSENDYNFLKRVYNNGDLLKYKNRLKAINFTGLGKVLDSGCGFGQWSLALAELNTEITATDIDNHRIDIANKIKDKLDYKNINYIRQSAQEMDFSDNYFDAIFSYSSIYFTPYRNTLQQFYKILKHGGKLYINANDLGWYIYNIIDGHNPASDYSPRDYSIRALANTSKYYATGIFEHKNTMDALCIPLNIITEELTNLGFEILNKGGDGTINYNNEIKIDKFFPAEKYGQIAVYEILCIKK